MGRVLVPVNNGVVGALPPEIEPYRISLQEFADNQDYWQSFDYMLLITPREDGFEVEFMTLTQIDSMKLPKVEA